MDKKRIFSALALVLLTGCQGHLATRLNDTVIQNNVRALVLSATPARVFIDSHGGQVLLTGEVADENTRAMMVQNAARARGVVRVYDFLTIGVPKTTSYTAQEQYLKTKIDALTLPARGLGVKTVVRSGVVYLLGTPKDAPSFVSSVQGVGGVLAVVPLLDAPSLAPVVRVP